MPPFDFWIHEMFHARCDLSSFEGYFFGGGWVSLPNFETHPSSNKNFGTKHVTYYTSTNTTWNEPKTYNIQHTTSEKTHPSQSQTKPPPKQPSHHLSSTSAPALACENCKRPCNFTMDIHIWSINSWPKWHPWDGDGQGYIYPNVW